MYISESIGTCLSRIYNLSIYVMDRIMPVEIQFDCEKPFDTLHKKLSIRVQLLSALEV